MSALGGSCGLPACDGHCPDCGTPFDGPGALYAYGQHYLLEHTISQPPAQDSLRMIMERAPGR